MIKVGDKRVAFVRMSNTENDGFNYNSTLVYSVNIGDMVAKGGLNFDKQGNEREWVGNFEKKYSPMSVEFMMSYDDVGSHTVMFQITGDEQDTFEFFQKQKIGLNTVWTQKQIIDGFVISEIEFLSSMDAGTSSLTMSSQWRGNLFASISSLEKGTTIAFKLEPNDFVDVDFSLDLFSNPYDNSLI